MSWKSTEALFGINKNFWRKELMSGGPQPVHETAPAAPLGGSVLSRGPPGPPPTSTPTPYMPSRGEKNRGESFMAFQDTEPPPSPNLSRVG